jgi:type I restriction-modification system DNA methylase subunit
MSEQIKQLDAWVKIWEKFEYFNLWNVTFKSLANANIIPKKDYWDYEIKRPDGLLIDRTDKKNPKVIAVVEYKSIVKFRTEKEINEAIKQCNDYAQVLWATFWVATDTNISVWINPKWKNKENNYIDDKWNKRSYEFIRDEEKQKLSNNFYLHLQKNHETDEEKLKDEIKESLKIIKRILDSKLSSKNSNLQDTIYVDPTNLAKSVWQDIYMATLEDPEKCLYNVVELFIFKFLSDLWILKTIYSFDYLIGLNKSWEKDEELLNHYANIIRPKIKKELFPADLEDWTTVINWTIFVNEQDEPVLDFSSLFRESIEKYNNFWNLVNVEKSFKTKLYETFLKKWSWVKWMGQFFTPRKVVWNIVEMAKVEKLQAGARVCDPFCWVWGFPLEVIAKRNNKDFVVKNNKIIENIEYFWFDKWSSKDSERTIILAKANMLIYLADLIKENSWITQEFSKIFNKTFSLKKWTLWTLADVSEKEEDKFDLIITNPPYGTNWVRKLKNEINRDWEKQDFYNINWNWVEWLSIEWIIKKLKNLWRAFIVLPDWILNRINDKKIREFLMNECEINWVISLPLNTFFTTNKRTYIVAITKKEDKSVKQTKSIFTYLVSDIWENLDTTRFDTWKSDLEVAKNLFRMFEWNEEYFSTNDKRCKIQTVSKFEDEINDNWTVDKWWTKEEKIELWMEEEEQVLNIKQFLWKIQEVKWKIENMEKELLELIK